MPFQSRQSAAAADPGSQAFDRHVRDGSGRRACVHQPWSPQSWDCTRLHGLTSHCTTCSRPHAHRPSHPARRHGRVLRVRRAARRSRRCEASRSPSAAVPPDAASSRPPATRRGSSACARRFRWRAPSASARHSSSSGRTSARYRAASQAVFEIFRSVTPLVEPLSLDEAYLDVTENAWGETLGRSVAQRLKREIRDTTGLTASAGVAPNKFLAKIASAGRSRTA